MSEDVQRKITVLHLLCVLPALQQRLLWFTLSLSLEAEEGENDDFGVSDSFGDVFERRFVSCHFLTHSLPKKVVAFKVWSCSELKANLTYPV